MGLVSTFKAELLSTFAVYNYHALPVFCPLDAHCTIFIGTPLHVFVVVCVGLAMPLEVALEHVFTQLVHEETVGHH